MGATFSRVKTWLAAQTLTAADLNAEFDNILNNLIPAGVDDESASDVAMQATADPYPGSAISKPTSLTGELQRLRYMIKQMTGNTYWYEDSLILSRLVLVDNLKPYVNASVNKLDIFTKSGGAVPDASNIISVAIPDGNGHTFRSRAAAYLSGTSQFIMADAANYWSKGSLDAEIKTAYVYAIWDGTGIVWALAGYSGFTRVPASTTETDDDFFLLEASSSYTKVVTDYCVCVGKIRYQYDTADAPDHTIQATVLDAPQVLWNPKSDYAKRTTLSTSNVSGGDIAEYAAVAMIVKQSGGYNIKAITDSQGAGVNNAYKIYMKTGSSTYASAVYKAYGESYNAAAGYSNTVIAIADNILLSAGDSIHMGANITSGSGNRTLYGDNYKVGCTALMFTRVS